MGINTFKYFRTLFAFHCIAVILLPFFALAGNPVSKNISDNSTLRLAYSARLDSWMRHSYLNSNSDFTAAFLSAESFPFTSASIIGGTSFSITKAESPTVGNASDYAAEEANAEEKILVVMIDAYGVQNYSKVVITDVDMEQSILIAKDILEKFPQGVYTVVASSANDLISQKLIIQ